MTRATAPRAPFDDLLGLEVVDASPDRVVATITIRSDMWQPYGIVHGGVYSTVVESTCSIGADMWIRAQGRSVVGVANHTNFLRSVSDGVLRVEALPVHRGRSQQLWQAVIHDERQRLIARGEVRFANLRPESGD